MRVTSSQRGLNGQKLGIAMALLVSSGCGIGSWTDASADLPYARVVNGRYEVIGDVSAYGIYERRGAKRVAFVELIPGVGIAGSEVAFRRPIPKGRTFVVTQARKPADGINKVITYVVVFDEPLVETDAEVHLVMSRGNDGSDSEPSQTVYRRIEAPR
jgi:hypothetical protein